MRKHTSRTLRVLAAMLSVLLLIPMLLSCMNGSGKTLMKLGSTSLSVNAYELLLSRTKGNLARSIGTDVENDAFWNTTVGSDGTTYNDYFTGEVLDSAKTFLVALHLFEQNNLKLPEETIEKIDETLEGLVIGDGDGSKSALNNILSAYGVNYDILREIYIMEAKCDYVETYLYGQGGSLIAENVKEEYMQNNYYCFRQIFLASYRYVYEEDAYGNEIYYEDDQKTYAYDKKNGTPKLDDNGKEIVDKNGDTVYFDADGNILYDKVFGKRAYITDDKGEIVVKDYTEEELKEVEAKMDLISSQVREGDFEDFEELMEEFSEDEDGMTNYKSGYYLKKGMSYNYDYLNDIVKALETMKDGETKLIKSNYGYHLVMKYACKEGAYAEKDNAIWFTEFSNDLIDYLFYNKTEEYKADIVVDKDLLATVDMKSVSINYYY